MSYTNPSPVGHIALVDEIIKQACSLNTLAAPAYSGTGDGPLDDLRASGAGPTETWTINCTTAAADGGTFSVVGSVSGAQADATVGVYYDNGFIQFIINDGAVDFVVNDNWTIVATEGALFTAGENPWVIRRRMGVRVPSASSFLGGQEAFRAFDETNSQWRTATGQDVPAWLQFESDGAVEVDRFFMEIDSDNESISPTAFDLQYSDDGVNWTTKESWSGVSFGIPIPTGITFTTTGIGSVGVHRYWRIYFTANKGGVGISLQRLHAEMVRDGAFVDIAGNNVTREVIMYGVGLAGQDELYIGLGNYELETSDIYSMKLAAFDGFNDAESFAGQPGASTVMSVPLWNFAIPTWLVFNGQRIAAVMKVDTVWMSFYLGKFFPYASPNQHPLPLVVGGVNANTNFIDFSDTGNSIPYKGSASRLKIRDAAGVWFSPDCWPYDNGATHRDLNGEHSMMPVIMSSSSPAVWGELDGILYVSGFNNAAENIIQAGGDDYLVFHDVYRTGNKDHFALRLT